MIETTLLYGGDIQIEFDSGPRHTYRVVINGRRYKVPSVTTITSVVDKSGPLMGWAINNTLDVCKGAISPGVEYAESYLEEVWNAAKRASKDIKSRASRRGTDLHNLIERSLASGEVIFELGEEANAFMRSFKFRELERKVYSRRFRYSGTLDAIGEDQAGQLCLLDWKTGKSIYPEYRLQTAAYVAAYEEEHPSQRIEYRCIVHIGEDGTFQPHYFPRPTLRKDFNAFLGAKALYERLQVIQKEANKVKNNL